MRFIPLTLCDANGRPLCPVIVNMAHIQQVRPAANGIGSIIYFTYDEDESTVTETYEAVLAIIQGIGSPYIGY